MRREVTRVVTPGTAADSSLGSEENNFLAALAQVGDRVGFAALDLSTGEFRATEFSGEGALRRVQEELEQLRPKELLYGSAAPLFEQPKHERTPSLAPPDSRGRLSPPNSARCDRLRNGSPQRNHVIRREDPVVQRSFSASSRIRWRQPPPAVERSEAPQFFRASGCSNSGAADPYSNSFGRSCSSSSCTRRSALSPENSVARNSPVERSSAAKPTRSPTCASAARKLFSSEPSERIRRRSRRDHPRHFAPHQLLRGSRASSICSQIATLKPLRISLPM